MFKFIRQYWFERSLLRKIRNTTKNLLKHPERYIQIDDGKLPSEEMIKDYYKRYYKKIEKENKEEWNTEGPISFEEYCENAKKWGKRYLFSTTATMMISDPGGPIIYM